MVVEGGRDEARRREGHVYMCVLVVIREYICIPLSLSPSLPLSVGLEGGHRC